MAKAETKFTPGPWNFSKQERATLAKMFPGEGNKGEAQANVSLMESAPKMYAALEAVEEATKNEDDFIAAVCAVRAQVSAALAAARGEQ